MLQPMRTKFRKAHKGRIKGIATSGVDLAFGQFGLKALEPERVTARQIEAARRALTRHMKRAGRVWIGLGQGDAGILGHPHQTGARPVRGRRRIGGDGARGARAGRRQAADQDAFHRAHRGVGPS